MKRSEMVNLIYETIYQHNKIPNMTMAEMANLILVAQERVGMLAPKVRVEEVRKAISPEGEEGTFVSWTYKSIWEDETSKQNKLKPTPLTDEELADVVANDEDL